MIQIFYRDLDGKYKNIDCEETDTIWVLACKISEKSNGIPSCYRIMYGMSQISNDYSKTIKDVGIQHGTDIDISIRLVFGQIAIKTSMGWIPKIYRMRCEKINKFDNDTVYSISDLIKQLKKENIILTYSNFELMYENRILKNDQILENLPDENKLIICMNIIDKQLK